MEENLKQIIRYSRDVVCEHSCKVYEELKTSFNQTSDKISDLARYVGLDDLKFRLFVEKVAAYRAKMEKDYNIRIAHVDVSSAHVLMNGLVQRVLQEHLKSSTQSFSFPTGEYSISSVEKNSNANGGFSNSKRADDRTGGNQILLSAIVWHCLRNSNSHHKETTDSTGKKTKKDVEKIRQWNRRIDEVDIVRKCGTPDHLKNDDTNIKRELEACPTASGTDTGKSNESYIVRKLKQKCCELKRLVSSKKAESAQSAKLNKEEDTKIPDNVDACKNTSNNSSMENMASNNNNSGTQLSKRVKDRSNKNQRISEMVDDEVNENGNADDAGRDAPDANTLTLQIPTNVKRIVLIKNGCRIVVEV